MTEQYSSSPVDNEVDVLDSPFNINEYDELLHDKFNISGDTPKERVEALKNLSIEGVAIMIEDINKSLQNSDESKMNHESAMHIGEITTISPEERYDVFVGLMKSIKESPDDINPERVGDALAMGIVMLHPFTDGNGRTSRIIGMTFRDNFDQSSNDRESDFSILSTSRDILRSNGEWMPNGYVPNMPEDFDQSDARDTSLYLQKLLSSNEPNMYTGPFGQADLYSPSE